MFIEPLILFMGIPSFRCEQLFSYAFMTAVLIIYQLRMAKIMSTTIPILKIFHPGLELIPETHPIYVSRISTSHDYRSHLNQGESLIIL